MKQLMKMTAIALVLGLAASPATFASDVAGTYNDAEKRQSYEKETYDKIERQEGTLEEVDLNKEAKEAWQGVKRNWEALKKATDENWQDAKSAFEESWEDFQKEWEDVTSDGS